MRCLLLFLQHLNHSLGLALVAELVRRLIPGKQPGNYPLKFKK